VTRGRGIDTTRWVDANAEARNRCHPLGFKSGKEVRVGQNGRVESEIGIGDGVGMKRPPTGFWMAREGKKCRCKCKCKCE
jgi:hypothetical protein